MAVASHGHASSAYESPVIVGTSPAMRRLRAVAERMAASDVKVLLTGESGVGKDLFARFIHEHSPRAARPFVAVSCAAIVESLLESELFGHVKGSFTGANEDRPGMFQLAHLGTIFLDEIGETSLRMQALLLRFLENGEVQPVGADQPRRRVDVRVLTATKRSLPELVKAGLFREDLMYRIDVVRIDIPPLRDRREDIAALVRAMAAKAPRPVTFSDAAIRVLERYRWPGNVRELQNVVERLVWTTRGPTIDADDLPEALRSVAAAVVPAGERRRQLADDLFTGLTSGALSFWEHVHVLFMNRDITRHDLRGLVSRALAESRGSYRAAVSLLGMPARDYKRFLNFLGSHECMVDFHPYRSGRSPDAEMRQFPLAGLKLLTPPTRGVRSRPAEGHATGGTGSHQEDPEHADSSKQGRR